MSDRGHPLGVLNDDERAQFGAQDRIPPNPARLVAGGVAGCGGLLFMGMAAMFVVMAIDVGKPLASILAGLAALCTLAISAVLWTLAWHWMHGLPLSMASATPAERRRLLEMGGQDLVVPKPMQTLMQPTATAVPKTTTADLLAQKRR